MTNEIDMRTSIQKAFDAFCEKEWQNEAKRNHIYPHPGAAFHGGVEYGRAQSADEIASLTRERDDILARCKELAGVLATERGMSADEIAALKAAKGEE